jgi:stress-induced morphogen
VLRITNDSWQHRHHAAMRAQGGGTGETRTSMGSYYPLLRPLMCRADFSVQIVSQVFKSKVNPPAELVIYKRSSLLQTTMQRHRLIYSALREELDGGLHALSLQTKTEEELAAAESEME